MEIQGRKESQFHTPPPPPVNRERRASVEKKEVKPPPYITGEKSFTSSSHPDHNDDAALVDAKHGVVGVFDGVGSSRNRHNQPDGAMASSMAMEAVKKTFEQGQRFFKTLEDAKEGLRTAFHNAHQNVVRYQEDEQSTAATTVSAVFVWENLATKERYAIVGSQGDSRVYRFRNDQLVLLTADDIVKRNGKSLIAKAIGHELAEDFGVHAEKAEKNDIYITVTDGAYGTFAHRDMERIVRDNKDSPQKIATALAEMSKSNGSSDDITAVALKIIS